MLWQVWAVSSVQSGEWLEKSRRLIIFVSSLASHWARCHQNRVLASSPLLAFFPGLPPFRLSFHQHWGACTLESARFNILPPPHTAALASARHSPDGCLSLYTAYDYQPPIRIRTLRRLCDLSASFIHYTNPTPGT